MALPRKLSSIKRFGTRYGRRVKHKLAKIESVQKGQHKCPSCRSMKVKRLSVGIWNCKKCDAKFAGKAYSTGAKITATKDTEEKESKDKESSKEAEEEMDEELEEDITPGKYKDA